MASQAALLCERFHRRRRRGAVFHPHLGENLFEMLVDGARADAENLADLAIGLAAADPQQHFGFAIGQPVALRQQALFGTGADLGDAEQPFIVTAARHQHEFQPGSASATSRAASSAASVRACAAISVPSSPARATVQRAVAGGGRDADHSPGR